MELCQEKIIHRDNVDRAAALMPPAPLLRHLGELYKALGEESRLKIVIALLSGELCVCDLAVVCGMSESAVSHQLRILRNLKIAANRRDGKVVFYRLADPLVRQMVEDGLAPLNPAAPEPLPTGEGAAGHQGDSASHATGL